MSQSKAFLILRTFLGMHEVVILFDQIYLRPTFKVSTRVYLLWFGVAGVHKIGVCLLSIRQLVSERVDVVSGGGAREAVQFDLHKFSEVVFVGGRIFILIRHDLIKCLIVLNHFAVIIYRF